MSISIRMVRDSLKSAVNNHDDPESLLRTTTISLNNKQIEAIDNLEVFGELEDLSLAHNTISVIENLEFLVNLR